MGNQISKLLNKLPRLPDGLKPEGKPHQPSQTPIDDRQSFAGMLGNLKITDNPSDLINNFASGLNLELPDGLKPAGTSTPLGRIPSTGGPSFGNMIGNVIKDVDELHKTAEQTTEKLITGELEDVHQVVVAMEEAQISFRLLMEVRNKLVEAYREVMKTQV
ncbi:MAG: flagellar hook-basal body complex protein FliE [Calditrichaeota bacterium]|nr:flagellar hook-basal body complex protein FliE [Calditrichota bacterium]